MSGICGSTAINSDIMDLESLPDCDIVYCDPPWEDRMVKFFQTQMKKQSGLVATNTIDGILGKLASLCPVSKPVFVEYSIKGLERVVGAMESSGHKHSQTVEAFQTNGNPYVILSFNTSVRIPDGAKGWEIVRLVIEATGAKVVSDPFAGIGQTAKAVIGCGAIYHGSEINPARYERLRKVVLKTETAK